MKKRILALILVVSMLLGFGSFMTGCNDDSGEEGKSSGDSSIDLGGRTVVIGAVTNGAPNEESDTYAEHKEFIASLEKKYNCKLEWYYTGNWHTYHSEILTKALSGEKIADFFWATGVDIFPKWALNDLVAPLDEYFDFTDEIWNQDYHEFVSYNGQHYGISNWNPAIGEVVFFNKKICAANGISDKELYELQRNKQWNWDNFLKYVQKTTKIGTNEDNTTYGFAIESHMPLYFLYSNDELPVLREGNTYTYNLSSAKSVEAIQFVYDLYRKYKVTPPIENGSPLPLWKKGKLAFYMAAMWSTPDFYEQLKEDEFGVLLTPIGKQATDYVNVTDTPQYLFMQPMVKDKDILAKLATDLYTPQPWSDLYDGYDPADDYLDYFFDEESAETLRMIEGKTIAECGAVSTDFRNQILWGSFGIAEGTDPRTWADSTQATGQYYLDSVWSQEFSAVTEE